jgi:hypothetical protein
MRKKGQFISALDRLSEKEIKFLLMLSDNTSFNLMEGELSMNEKELLLIYETLKILWNVGSTAALLAEAKRRGIHEIAQPQFVLLQQWKKRTKMTRTLKNHLGQILRNKNIRTFEAKSISMDDFYTNKIWTDRLEIELWSEFKILRNES